RRKKPGLNSSSAEALPPNSKQQTLKTQTPNHPNTQTSEPPNAERGGMVWTLQKKFPAAVRREF
ncbi:MAG TPA: hypothetical protein VLT56_09695, partial [Desulfobacterales bacterium]|nr:hypothetical protein [Desulfobacterales bacterium]